MIIFYGIDDAEEEKKNAKLHLNKNTISKKN